jgi:uncharacterized protein (TIGR00661 family)
LELSAFFLPIFAGMKVLYAIQGTGNGHIARATELVPILEKQMELHTLISGNSSDLKPNFNIHYRFHGLPFIFGKNGGIDYLGTLRQNNFVRFLKEIHKCPVEDYDLILTDFEPISAWAAWRKNIPSISLSHQCALLSRKVPRPDKVPFYAHSFLKWYAPAKHHIGFHFKRYDDFIFTPVIRSEIRYARTQNLGHYTVYLPAYSDHKIIQILEKITSINWHIFSKHAKEPYQKKNCLIFPPDQRNFIQSFTTCTGILCGGGFETPAEAIFMKKKLMVIPMSVQFEQHFNAKALEEMGFEVANQLSDSTLPQIESWTEKEFPTTSIPEYKDQSDLISERILQLLKSH